MRAAGPKSDSFELPEPSRNRWGYGNLSDWTPVSSTSFTHIEVQMVVDGIRLLLDLVVKRIAEFLIPSSG